MFLPQLDITIKYNVKINYLAYSFIAVAISYPWHHHELKVDTQLTVFPLLTKYY
jgi:hypothetical protein